MLKAYLLAALFALVGSYYLHKAYSYYKEATLLQQGDL